MSLSEHEKLYSPSQWSKRFGPMELVARFVNLANNATIEARKVIKCRLNVSYGPTEGTKYDIYGTDLPEDAPVFVFIHGGYWQELSKDLSTFPVKSLVSQGIKVVVVGYDLCPKVKVGDIVSEIKAAIGDILKLAQKSGSRSVWVGGHSVGAHLAASLLDPAWFAGQCDHGSLLKGLVLIAGIYNIVPLLDTTANDALKMTSEEAKALSIGLVEPENPIQNLEVIVAVGECDSPAFVEESRRYAQKLVKIVDQVEYVLLRNNTDHFDIVEKLTDKDYTLTKLIVQKMH